MTAVPISGVSENEIALDTYRFPTRGPVRLSNIAVVPNPIIFGDTTKAGDTQIMSQEIATSAAGGSGIYKAQARTDVDRHWKSRAETAFRNQITLPPLAYDLGKPSGLTGEDPLVSEEYRNGQYVAFAGARLYRWEDAAAVFNDDGSVVGGWSGLLGTLPANPTDMKVYRDALFVACDTGLAYWSLPGAVVTVVGSSPARFLEVWDERLYRLVQTSGVWTLYGTPDVPGAAMTWTAGGVFPTNVTPTQLTTFRNVVGEIVLAALSDVGLWLYDAATAKWKWTEVRIPRIGFGQGSRGCLFRDGKLYFSSGSLGMVSVQPGNPFIASPMGLDQEDSVPTEDSGRISGVTADFNYVLALVDATLPSTQDDYLSGTHNPYDGWDWPAQTGLSTLRKWNGGWHVIWESSSSATPGYFVTTSGAYDKRRAYWGNNGRVYCIDLYAGVHNPRRNPIAKFSPGPRTHLTPWFDYGSDVQRKVQGHVYVRTSGCSATETVTISYGLDYDDGTWFTLGVVVSNGITTFTLGEGAGVPGRAFRFRLDFTRGPNALLTPVVEVFTSEFLRLLPAQYGYAVEVDLSKPYNGLTPAQMEAVLQRLSDPEATPTLILFAYKDALDDEPQTHWCRISKLDGQAFSGTDLRGQSNYRVSLMVPYRGDSV